MGFRPFGLKCVSICYINYSRKLPKVFIYLTSGIRVRLVCSEGGDVFMVPMQRGQRKPKWPTHKNPGEKRRNKRKTQQKNIANCLNNGVVQGSHRHGRAGFPWMCVQG